MMKKIIPRFTPCDFLIWSFSALAVFLSYVLFPQGDIVSMIGSLIGVTALILVAKGAVLGQFLMLLFCLFYGVQSALFHYYGEMITYFGMSLPAVIFNIVSWIRHPYRDSAQVTVAPLTAKKIALTCLLDAAVTAVFYFLLAYLNTAQLLVSTFSVATSVLASALSFQRSPWYAVAYAANDVVLVVLWGITFLQDPSILPVLVCFGVFLINDLYGFISWQRMKKEQEI